MDPAVSPTPLHYMRITPLDEDGNPFYSVDGNKITFHKTGTYRLGNALGTVQLSARTQDVHVRFYDEEPDTRTAPVARSTTDCTIVAADTRTQVALGDRELPEVFTTHNLGANVEVIARRTSGPNGSALVDMMINGERDDRRKLRETVNTWTTEAQRRPWATLGHPRDAVQFVYDDQPADAEGEPLTVGGIPFPLEVSKDYSPGPVDRTASASGPSSGDVHSADNHRCRCGKLDGQTSTGCEWHGSPVRTSASLCATKGGCTLGDAVYIDSGMTMPDLSAEPHMSIHLQDGASTKPKLACRHYAHHHGDDGCTLCDCTAPRTTFTDQELAEKLCDNATYRSAPPLITAEQIAACAEVNESVHWSLRQWALMAKKCMDAQASNLGNVHDMLRHLDGPRGQATLANAHAIEMLRQTVGYYPDDEETMQREHDTALADGIAVNHLVRSMRAAAAAINSVNVARPQWTMLDNVARSLLADADAWAHTRGDEPDDEGSDQDGLNLSDIQVSRGPIAYPVASWSVPMGRVTRANHTGCEHVLELHAERSGCQVDDCPCKATLSSLREWLTSGHADLMPGEPHSTGPEETEALQQPREGTPITQRFAEVVAVLEDMAKAARAVQVRLEPADQARLGLALARVQKLLGQ